MARVFLWTFPLQALKNAFEVFFRQGVFIHFYHPDARFLINRRPDLRGKAPV